MIGVRGLLAGSFFGAEAFLPLMLVREGGLSPTLAGGVLTCGAIGWAAGAWRQGRPAVRTPRHHLMAVARMMVGLGALALVPVALGVVSAPGARPSPVRTSVAPCYRTCHIV